jgi:hypothetical protein
MRGWKFVRYFTYGLVAMLFVFSLLRERTVKNEANRVRDQHRKEIMESNVLSDSAKANAIKIWEYQDKQ